MKGRVEGRGRRERAKITKQKYSKINKFPKSPFSRAGIPIVRFVMHMAAIKDQNSALEMAIGHTAEIAKFHQ